MIRPYRQWADEENPHFVVGGTSSAAGQPRGEILCRWRNCDDPEAADELCSAPDLILSRKNSSIRTLTSLISGGVCYSDDICDPRLPTQSALEASAVVFISQDAVMSLMCSRHSVVWNIATRTRALDLVTMHRRHINYVFNVCLCIHYFYPAMNILKHHTLKRVFCNRGNQRI